LKQKEADVFIISGWQKASAVVDHIKKRIIISVCGNVFMIAMANLLTGNTFKQNDLVIVNITLERSYSTDIENVVITDLLPAGFEIENHGQKKYREWNG
jgi:hypothetical protein